MADFVFPLPEVGEFKAPNGLTYSHDGQKWRVKSLPGVSSDIEERLELLEKALLPWVEFTDEYRSCYYNSGSNYVNASVRMYQYWGSSPAGTWTWAWMVKFPGSDDWIDVDDLDDDAARSIGYDGTEHANYLYLYPTTDTIPEIEVKLLVTDSLEGFETVEAWADPFFPAPVWENKGAKAAAVAKTKPHKSGRSAPVRQLLN